MAQATAMSDEDFDLLDARERAHEDWQAVPRWRAFKRWRRCNRWLFMVRTLQEGEAIKAHERMEARRARGM